MLEIPLFAILAVLCQIREKSFIWSFLIWSHHCTCKPSKSLFNFFCLLISQQLTSSIIEERNTESLLKVEDIPGWLFVFIACFESFELVLFLKFLSSWAIYNSIAASHPNSNSKSWLPTTIIRYAAIKHTESAKRRRTTRFVQYMFSWVTN